MTNPPVEPGKAERSADVAARLVEVSNRLDQASADLRRLVEQTRAALEGRKSHARTH